MKELIIQGSDESVNASIKMFEHVLMQQANIKCVRYTADAVSGLVRADFGRGIMYPDFTMTPEIEAEGYARELIRRIQQMRKDMKLDVECCINCEVDAEPNLIRSLEQWMEHIASETRSRSVVFTDSPGGDDVKEWDIQGKNVTIGITSEL